MLTLGIETIVILLLIMGAVSAFGGYVVAQERQRRAGGGKSAAELRAELVEYKDSVNEHFQTTAGLLHDMTEQYRAVYEHMASGAQNLCDPETAQSQIESLRAGLLPSAAAAPDATAVAEDVEHTDTDTDTDTDVGAATAAPIDDATTDLDEDAGDGSAAVVSEPAAADDDAPAGTAADDGHAGPGEPVSVGDAVVEPETQTATEADDETESAAETVKP